MLACSVRVCICNQSRTTTMKDFERKRREREGRGTKEEGEKRRKREEGGGRRKRERGGKDTDVPHELPDVIDSIVSCITI